MNSVQCPVATCIRPLQDPDGFIQLTCRRKACSAKLKGVVGAGKTCGDERPGAFRIKSCFFDLIRAVGKGESTVIARIACFKVGSECAPGIVREGNPGIVVAGRGPNWEIDWGGR